MAEDKDEATLAAEAAAHERRNAILAVREALRLDEFEQRLATLGPVEHYEARVWVDALRAGVTALAAPPPPPELDPEG